MPHLSQTSRFLQSPSFRQAHSALIGQLTQCIVIGRTPQASVGNIMPLSIIASFSFQNKCKTVNNALSFTIISSREGNRVTWQTVMVLVCVCTQAAVVMWPYLPLSQTWAHTHKMLHCDPLSLSLTLAHTHVTLLPSAKLRIWTVNSKYLN